MIPQFQPYIDKKYAKKVVKQVESGWIGPGKVTEEFEKRIANLMGVKYAIAATSGTISLLIAIESLNIPKNKKILFPSYTMLAGANAARFMGYDVELIDIKEDTLSMDPESIKFDDSIGAIIFVDHNGYHGPDLLRIRELCSKNSIPLIEDSAQCLGLINEIIGDVAVVSFSVPKILTTSQGGMVLTNDEEIYKKCLQIRDHGDNWRKTRVHNFIGVNFKFNDILASFGIAQLDNFDVIMKKKRDVWKWYKRKLNILDFGSELTWMVMYKSKNVDKIIEELRKENIEAVRYYLPIHWNPPYKSENGYLMAEKIYNDYVYLPSSLSLTKKQVNKICDIVLGAEKNVNS